MIERVATLVGAVCAALGLLAAVMLWVFDIVEWTPTANRREAALRAHVKTEVDRLRDEATARNRVASRADAWSLVATKRLEAVILRNRVNDCDAKKDLSPIERNACLQYRTELDTAQHAYDRMLKEAQDASRD